MIIIFLLLFSFSLFYHCPLISFHPIFNIVFHSRARGETITTATWMRDFVSHHPNYKHDSVISQEIAHDLLVTCKRIGEGIEPCQPILGEKFS
jgi:hypothetical protein